MNRKQITNLTCLKWFAASLLQVDFYDWLALAAWLAQGALLAGRQPTVAETKFISVNEAKWNAQK